MKNESMIETAFELLTASETSMRFADLWAAVKEALLIGPDEEPERIGRFYTDLSLDGRFVAETNNVWGLRSRTKYEDVHIDMSDAYDDVDTTDNDSVDLAEEARTNQYVNNGVITDDVNDLGGIDDDYSERKRDPNAEELGIDGEEKPGGSDY